VSIQARFRTLTAPQWLRPVQFLVHLGAWQPRVVAAASLTVSLLGLVEGLGVALLIPMLGLLGVDTGTSVRGPAEALTRLFGWAGVPITLTSVLTVFVLVGLAQILLHAAQQALIIYAGERMTFSLRVALFDAMTRASWPHILSTKAGHLSSRILTEASRLGIIYGNSISACGLVILFAIYAGLAAWLSWPLTLMVLVIGVVSTLALRAIYASSRRFGSFTSAAASYMEHVLSEHLRAAKLIRMIDIGRWSSSKFEEAAAAVSRYARRNNINAELVRTSVEPLGLIFVVTILYVSIAHAAMPAAHTLVFLAIFYRLAPRMVHLQQLVQRIYASLPAYESISQTFAQLHENRERTGGKSLAKLRSGIEVKDVSIAADDQIILSAVSFGIAAGAVAAIVGPSGAGKTTLIEVMLGVRPCAGGQITFDGVSLDELDLQQLRRKIGYVPQDGQFFHDTIAANLRLCNPDASDSEIWEALGQARAAAFVNSLPDKLDTVMGTQGFKLSGGERQRLALTRALLGKPDILILDEPTSALDAATEREFIDSLNGFRGKLTMIIVAHRPALVAGADMILNVTGGTVELTTRPAMRAVL
jgi:ATP-binding cassette, subfamily C, bacterial